MTPEVLKQFNEGDKKVHIVESEWHYPILTKHGYIPLDKSKIGFVRHYNYEHPITKHMVTMCTGVNADYWECSKGGFGYWSALEPHLQKMATLD